MTIKITNTTGMFRNIIVLFFISLLVCCKKDSSEINLKLWYKNPAKDWNEALPLGNGRLGAMVFGDPQKEHLQLNEETVWAGGPHNNVNPEVAPYLVKVRDLIFAGKYAESHQVANAYIKSHQNGMPFQTMGDLYLEFPDVNDYSEYYRELDIERAISKVKFSSNQTKYTREIFSSFPDQVIVIRLTADKPASITCNILLTSLQKHTTQTTGSEIIMKGNTTDHEGIPGQVKFTTIIRPVITHGSIVQYDTSLSIKNADEAIIYISAGTNFVNYKDITGDDENKATTYLNHALDFDYKTAKKSHIAYYQSYFNRVKLDLGTTDSVNKPTDIRIQQFKDGNDPKLAELYFQYGRYLLISSSQPGGQPATLQGIWNDKLFPPWESKYTININCEMNYWPSEITNLSELNEPLFRMIKELSETGCESAQKLYDARGWVAHHNTDIWRVTGIFDRATYGMWQSGSNWLTQHLWQHYLYTGDTAFLKEYYPVMKAAAEFYVDELVPEPHVGYLVISPSNSPENKFMNIASSSAGTTMDNQLMFDLFSNVIQASEILNCDHAFADTLKNKRDSLAPMQVGRYNQLQEWLYDWDDPNDNHRHISHLYGLYPGNQISAYRNPELFQAAKQSLIYRGDESTGWSMGWKVNLWARLLDGNHAYLLIKDQISPAIKPNGEAKGGTYPNLLDAHPPFQIDGNFGCTAGIAEMLIQSHDGYIFILPALPVAWPNGKAEGLKTRGGFELSIEWENGKIKIIQVKSTLGGNLRLRVKDEIIVKGTGILRIAEGDNPNPLFAINPVKKPLISQEANTKELVLDRTWLYDFQTEKNKTYKFKLKNSQF